MAKRPHQIQSTIDEAERIAKEIAAQADGGDPATDPPISGDPAPAEEVHAPSDSATASDDPSAPQATSPASGDVAPATPASSSSELETLRHELDLAQQRYRSFQGSHQSQIAKLTEELAQLRKQREEDADYMRELEEATSRYEVSQLETLGEDDVESLRKMARAEAISVARELRAELATIQQSIAKLSEQTTESINQVETTRVSSRDMYLDQHVPQWRQLDTDPGFTAWLKGKVPLTNLTRFQMLFDARDAGDHPRLASIFQSYLSETGAQPSAQVPTPEPVPAPAAPSQAPVDPIQFVAPGTAGQADAVVPTTGAVAQYNGRPYVTDQDFNLHFAKKARGEYASAAEAEAAERELHRATLTLPYQQGQR